MVLLKNSTAQAGNENPLLTKVDYQATLDVIYGQPSTVLFFEKPLPLMKRSNLIFKRTVDLLLSSVLIILLLSWLLPFIALFIKLNSKGPVFFFQKRNKKDGRLFTCIKFRTMVVNAEADSLPAYENDKRITRTGKFLRRHHLDELPQLVNVWWGDMSMIGPRPYMISDNEKYATAIQHFLIRHKIKPGITGLAQLLKYRSFVTVLEDMNARSEKDIYYIHNWSPALDVKILIQTFFKIIGIK